MNIQLSRRTALMLATLLLLLSACTVQPSELEPDPSLSPAPPIPSGSPESAEKTLVWAMPGFQTPGGSEFKQPELWMETFNRALREKGADFDVEFLPLGGMIDGLALPNEDGEFYLDIAIRTAASGQQIDLLYVGGGSIQVDWYMQAYTAGLTAPLDDLLQTESGQIVRDFHAESTWNAMKINGEIHGLFVGISRGAQSGYLFEKDWLAEREVNGSDLSASLASLRPAFRSEIDKNIFDSTADIQYISQMLGGFMMAPGITLSESGAYAFLESDILRNYLAELRDLYDEGVLRRERTDYEERPTPSVFWGDQQYPEVFLTPNFIAATSPNLSSETNALAIGAASEYKDECMQLLAWLFTDRELADLLVYGIEGIHYVRQDGYVQAPDENSTNPDVFTVVFTGTFHATTPCDSYYLGVSERAKAYMETLPDGVVTGFHFDIRGWESVLDELNTILERVQFMEVTLPDGEVASMMQGFLTGHDPDWEATLAGVITEMNEAGLSDLLAEINRQYNEWLALYCPIAAT